MRLPDRVDEVTLGDGYAATVGTLRAMCDLVARRHTEPELRARMRAITAGLPSGDFDAEIAAVWRFILAHVRYLRDPLGVEHVTDPLELDREIDEGDGTAQEDCESIALYAATLFASAGYRSAFVVIGRDPSAPDLYTHCYLMVQQPRTKQWINFDPVAAWNDPRLSLGDTAWREGDPIEIWGLDGKKVDAMPIVHSNQFQTATSEDIMRQFLGELLGDTMADARKVADATAGGLVQAGGPWGAIFGGVIKAGEGIWDVATTKAPDPKSTIKVEDAKKGDAKGDAKKGDAKKGDEKKTDWPMIALGIGGAALLLKAIF